MGKIIYRSLDIMPADVGDSFIIEGYATKWNRYRLGAYKGEDVYEQIERNAFSEGAIKDVVLLYNHAGRALARTTNGTLKLALDDVGLKMWANLSLTTRGRELYEEIRSGLITQMSWSFIAKRMTFDSKTRTFHVKEVERVYDVSPVIFPANDQTEVAARAFGFGSASALAEQIDRYLLAEVISQLIE